MIQLYLAELHRITIVDEKGPTAAVMETCFSFGADAAFHLIGLYASEHHYHGRNDDGGVWNEVAMRFIPDAHRRGCERIAPWFSEKTPARVSLDEAIQGRSHSPDRENAAHRSGGSVLQDQCAAAVIDQNQPSLFDSECRLVESRSPKAEGRKREYPTAAALVMARAQRRLAGKYGDLGLARAAKKLHERAISAIKKRQSVLSDCPSSRERSSYDPMAAQYAEDHKRFLEQNRPDVLDKLRRSGDLNSYLSSVGEQASDRFETLMRQYQHSPDVQKCCNRLSKRVSIRQFS